MNTQSTTNEASRKVPTKVELINYFKDQVEIKQQQLKMQELNTKIAKLRAEEVDSFARIAMITHGVQNPVDGHERPSGPNSDIVPEPDLAQETAKTA